MAEASKKDIGKILPKARRLMKQEKQAVKEAVLRHKNAENSIVTIKVWLKPEEIAA